MGPTLRSTPLEDIVQLGCQNPAGQTIKRWNSWKERNMKKWDNADEEGKIEDKAREMRVK